MGITFVLFGWAFLLTFASIPVAIGLFVWSRRKQKRSGTKWGVFRSAAAAFLPFVLLGYGATAFVPYAIWSVAVRQVDPGIGDSWQVPVGNDSFFCMIDTTDNSYLLKGGCTGVPPVFGITQLAALGDRIVGNSRSSGPFMFDTRSGKVQSPIDLDTALGQFSPRPTLQTPDEFYSKMRWGWPDLIALVLISIPALCILLLWYRWFIRTPVPIPA